MAKPYDHIPDELKREAQVSTKKGPSGKGAAPEKSAAGVSLKRPGPGCR